MMTFCGRGEAELYCDELQCWWQVERQVERVLSDNVRGLKGLLEVCRSEVCLLA